VERGRISQVAQTEYLNGKVSYTDCNHTDFPFICFIAGLCQTGAVKVCTQVEPFHSESQNIFNRFKNGMETT
jgi:hypothetical protein